MPECKKCGNGFPNWVIVEGKRRNLASREYCLGCSPFGQHNTKILDTVKFDNRTLTNKTLDSTDEYYNCPECGKKFCKNGLKTHIWRVHTEEGKDFNPNRGYKDGSRVIWNKGLNASDPRIKLISEKQRKSMLGRTTRPHTEEEKIRLSEIAKMNKFGGHTSKKAIYYKCIDGSKVYLHSSYEVRVAESLDKSNIRWTRPEPLWWVDADNIKHRYYPDFYLVDYNIFLDPKNSYLRVKDRDKIDRVAIQNNVIVLILDEEHLEWEKIMSIILSQCSSIGGAPLL